MAIVKNGICWVTPWFCKNEVDQLAGKRNIDTILLFVVLVYMTVDFYQKKKTNHLWVN